MVADGRRQHKRCVGAPKHIFSVIVLVEQRIGQKSPLLLNLAKSYCVPLPYCQSPDIFFFFFFFFFCFLKDSGLTSKMFERCFTPIFLDQLFWQQLWLCLDFVFFKLLYLHFSAPKTTKWHVRAFLTWVFTSFIMTLRNVLCFNFLAVQFCILRIATFLNPFIFLFPSADLKFQFLYFSLCLLCISPVCSSALL